MALILCPECNKQVSTLAASCPGCGAPIQQPNRVVVAGQDDAVVTELTSKPLKLQLIVSAALLFGGCAIAALSGSGNDKAGQFLGMLIFVVGLVWFIATKVRVWWHHE